MLTLDETILYCNRRAKSCRDLAIISMQKGYFELEGEYLQFEAYLKELKRLRETERPKGEWIIQTVTTIPPHQEFICPFCKTVVNRMTKFCHECGADMRGLKKNENSVE